MPYREVNTELLNIWFRDGNSECVLAAHGGYTPKRRRWKTLGIQTAGSGMVDIPPFIAEVVAYADADRTSSGDFAKLAYDNTAERVAHLRADGYTTAELRPILGTLGHRPDPETDHWYYANRDSMINYSLTYNENAQNFYPAYGTKDLVRIRVGQKAHLADVFEELGRLNRRYDRFHYGACRVNKVTYSTAIGGPS